MVTEIPDDEEIGLVINKLLGPWEVTKADLLPKREPVTVSVTFPFDKETKRPSMLLKIKNSMGVHEAFVKDNNMLYVFAQAMRAILIGRLLEDGTIITRDDISGNIPQVFLIESVIRRRDRQEERHMSLMLERIK